MRTDLPTLASLEEMGPSRAAALWLERMQSEDGDEDDTLFQQWLSASEANRLAWKRAIDLWDSFDEADGNDDLVRMRQEALSFRPRRQVPRWASYAVAASLTLVASSGLYLERDRLFGSPAAPDVAAVTQPDMKRFGPIDYATATGQRSTVTLPDGSKVTLDTNSAIDVAYMGRLRLVRLLRGQAFFDVVHKATQPFRVAAGGRIFSVLGTRFNIRLADTETRALLVQGAIGVSKGDDPANPPEMIERMEPGQELIARAGQDDRISAADVEQNVQWRRGFVQFDNETLASAAAELNRYAERHLVVRDPAVAQMRVSGAFRTNDIQGFAQTLAELYPVQVVPTKDGNLEIVRQP